MHIYSYGAMHYLKMSLFSRYLIKTSVDKLMYLQCLNLVKTVFKVSFLHVHSIHTAPDVTL